MATFKICSREVVVYVSNVEAETEQDAIRIFHESNHSKPGFLRPVEYSDFEVLDVAIDYEASNII